LFTFSVSARLILRQRKSRMKFTSIRLFAVVLFCVSPITAQAGSQSGSEIKSPAPASAQQFRDMENAIRSGEFKKIGSVLVARHSR
jgi:hypothetical protein